MELSPIILVVVFSMQVDGVYHAVPSGWKLFSLGVFGENKVWGFNRYNGVRYADPQNVIEDIHSVSPMSPENCMWQCRQHNRQNPNGANCIAFNYRPRGQEATVDVNGVLQQKPTRCVLLTGGFLPNVRYVDTLVDRNADWYHYRASSDVE